MKKVTELIRVEYKDGTSDEYKPEAMEIDAGNLLIIIEVEEDDAKSWSTVLINIEHVKAVRMYGSIVKDGGNNKDGNIISFH